MNQEKTFSLIPESCNLHDFFLQYFSKLIFMRVKVICSDAIPHFIYQDEDWTGSCFLSVGKKAGIGLDFILG